MIMDSTALRHASMGQLTSASPEPSPRATRRLGERLELVEDLWQEVLRSECPPGQAERLLRLKQLSEPTGDGDGAIDTGAIVQLIREMDLAEAIAAARAFSLYFQLVNILEQHIEEDSYLDSLKTSSAPAFTDPFLPPLASQNEPATFRQLFERLRALNVPPARIETLLRNLDLRLVFTAHPTEIVRHTVRHKQRKVAALIHKLEQDTLLNTVERQSLRLQLEEEIRLCTTSSRCCSTRCPICASGSARPWAPASPMWCRPAMASAASARGWAPTATATPR
jgi:phosphoenolpyruvate carboxylase